VPLYRDLNPDGLLGAEWKADEAGRKRAVGTLLKLRTALDHDTNAPPPRAFGKLLLGTWNLREFDSTSWGARLPEAYAYIAEIIDRFDLVAVQEVREDLRALERLVQRLGGHWDYLVSDVTEGGPGNHERLAFLYDTHKVRFLGMAGELVLPPVRKGKEQIPASQVARTPLMAAFQVGWTKFVLTTVHIIYGEDTAEPAARIEEIERVARFLRNRTDSETELIRNFVVLGDFNIFTKGDATMRALTDAGKGGFEIPLPIQDLSGSNVGKDKKYDQIAYRAPQGRFSATGRAGCFDYYDHVFTDADTDTYRRYIDAYIKAREAEGHKSPKPPKSAAAAKTQYRTWRTYQMSDHLPLWAEFDTDFADEYLTELNTP
jgi:endonuclease/exonuclease/phosphatase family metal-dependent hydrolase